MNIEFKNTDSGLKAVLGNKSYALKYSGKVWKSYPRAIKQVLIDNLAHLLTINMPLVSGFNKLKYNTALPVFKSLFHEIVVRSIPHGTDDYADSTEDVLKRFLNTSYVFEDYNAKLPKYTGSLNEKAVVPLSMGKDSLLTIAVCKEIGLKPSAVYVNDTVSPSENRIKLRFTKKLCSQERIPLNHVTNELENLNDFELWDADETCIGYTHMITGFAFISLPLLHYYKAKYVVLGNQQDMNFPYTNNEGFSTYPAYDQTSVWTKQLSSAIRRMTSNQARVVSVIEPLTNIAAMKVLFHRYPEFAKYEISCDCLNASKEARWCHSCNKCARLSLFIRAVGAKPKHAGFTKNLMQKKHMKLYSLFKGAEVDSYEKSTESRDQQLLAFYMLYKNGYKAPLIDAFKKKYLREAKQREDELHKKFFSIHNSITMPAKIKKKVEKIYREELE